MVTATDDPEILTAPALGMPYRKNGGKPRTRAERMARRRRRTCATRPRGMAPAPLAGKVRSRSLSPLERTGIRCK